jgi:alkylhydroperoxidase domain protein
MSIDQTLRPAVVPPTAFTQANIGWQPWLEPVSADELDDLQRDALIDAGRAKSPYFRLLVHDPAILKARTLTDLDIFYNPTAGLPRGEREFAAAATSRFNGCIFCASVHARFASHFVDDPAEVAALLAGGVDAEFSPRTQAIVGAAVALTRTPIEFGPDHVLALRGVGLDDGAIADLIHAAAFFNWANRLMLSLGEPDAGNLAD